MIEGKFWRNLGRSTILHRSILALLLVACFFIFHSSNWKEQQTKLNLGPVIPLVSSTQIQLSNRTSENRYPEFFRFIANYTNALSNNKLRVLSFGASTGMEAMTLSRYFPRALIFGVDIDEETVMLAREYVKNESRIFIFNGKNVSAKSYGPYDIIFANSVLCVHIYKPELRHLNASTLNASTLLPFDTFATVLKELDSMLKHRGVLLAVNAQYDIEEVLHSYKPLRLPDCISDCNYLHFKLCHPNVPVRSINGTAFKYDSSTDSTNKDSKHHCMFKKP